MKKLLTLLCSFALVGVVGLTTMSSVGCGKKVEKTTTTTAPASTVTTTGTTTTAKTT